LAPLLLQYLGRTVPFIVPDAGHRFSICCAIDAQAAPLPHIADSSATVQGGAS
jgi:hypothetical protein